jgi:uroporphyrinogen decarboxylase
MHPRVEQLPKPAPDYRRFLQVLRRERPERVPLIELAVHSEVVNTLLDEPAATGAEPRLALQIANERAVRLHHRLGYDVMKVSAPIPFHVKRLKGEDPSVLSAGERDWTDEHRGPIGSMADFDGFRWPTLKDVDFGPVEAATKVLPDGMKLIGFSGGVLEFAMDLIGMERLMLATRRDPALVAAVIERVGQTIYRVFETYCQFDSVCALWLGDDLGHKHGTLLSPKWLIEHIVPWYKRFADLAHAHGRPFLLHTCGNTAAVMPAIVETGIDAKHSFEDGIEPVEQFHDRWADKIAVLGGVDVHLLATGDAATIKARMRQILEHCAVRGGYAAGSGNSIPNYVPAESYLAMVEAVAEFNGL